MNLKFCINLLLNLLFYKKYNLDITRKIFFISHKKFNYFVVFFNKNMLFQEIKKIIRESKETKIK